MGTFTVNCVLFSEGIFHIVNAALIYVSCHIKALERELAPVEERLNRLEQMAYKVVRGSSSEGRTVNEREAEINDLWDKLKVSHPLPPSLS